MYFSRLLLILAFTFSGLASAADAPSWQADKSGVAWVVNKRQFLVMNKEIYGYNYDVKTSVRPEGENYQIVMEIPVDKFSSGEADRDKEVAVILKGDVSKTMTFTSAPYSKADFQKILTKQTKAIVGDLEIGKTKSPVSFDISYEGDAFLLGSVTTKMSHLGVEAPAAGGGLVLKISDDLKLLVRLQLKDIALAH